jgi:tetratricopeptide (TPR) repeat protein
MPTENDEAYELYLRAAHFNRLIGRNAWDQQADLLRQAVTVDAGFGVAWAEFARTLVWLHGNFGVPGVGEEAAAALARAEELAPEAVETQVARGAWEYFVDYDLPAALASFRRAVELKPSDPDIYNWIALVERRAGHWDDAQAAHRKSLALDPLSARILGTTNLTQEHLRDFDSAVRLSERLAQIQPGLGVYGRIFQSLAHRTGDLDSLRTWMDSVSRTVSQDHLELPRAWLAYYERDYEKAVGIPQWRLCYVLGDLACLKALGDTMRTNAQRDLAVLEANPVPMYPMRTGVLQGRIALGYALRGDRGSALEWGTRAVETMPPSVDAYAGPGRLAGLADIHILLGERDQAIEKLDQVLRLPNMLTVNRLKLDPWYDSLRDHPGFQSLLVKYESHSND